MRTRSTSVNPVWLYKDVHSSVKQLLSQRKSKGSGLSAIVPKRWNKTHTSRDLLIFWPSQSMKTMPQEDNTKCIRAPRLGAKASATSLLMKGMSCLILVLQSGLHRWRVQETNFWVVKLCVYIYIYVDICISFHRYLAGKWEINQPTNQPINPASKQTSKQLTNQRSNQAEKNWRSRVLCWVSCSGCCLPALGLLCTVLMMLPVCRKTAYASWCWTIACMYMCAKWPHQDMLDSNTPTWAVTYSCGQLDTFKACCFTPRFVHCWWRSVLLLTNASLFFMTVDLYLHFFKLIHVRMAMRPRLPMVLSWYLLWISIRYMSFWNLGPCAAEGAGCVPHLVDSCVIHGQNEGLVADILCSRLRPHQISDVATWFILQISDVPTHLFRLLCGHQSNSPSFCRGSPQKKLTC